MTGSQPENLKYTRTHEWLRLEEEYAICGITDHAQEILSDIERIELPAVGNRVKAGARVAILESAKAVTDVHTPLTGEISEVNEELAGEPAIINKDPYGRGWLFKLRFNVVTEQEKLMSAVEYHAFLKS